MINYDELIAFVIRETGWSLEYTRNLPLYYLHALVEEFRYIREQEAYERAHNAALIVCTLASSQTRRYKPCDIIGEPPKRSCMTTKKLTREPKIYYLKLLDGKEYELPVLNVNVLADLEEAFQQGLEGISELFQTRQFSALRKAIYVLLHRKYDLTEDKIGELIDLSNAEDVTKVIAEYLSGEQ